MSITQTHLDNSISETYRGFITRDWAKCKDGFEVSIQASGSHYCLPRDGNGIYTHVELGFPSEYMGDEFQEYAEDPEKPTDTVYSCVPLEMIDRLIESHGGLVND